MDDVNDAYILIGMAYINFLLFKGKIKDRWESKISTYVAKLKGKGKQTKAALLLFSSKIGRNIIYLNKGWNYMVKQWKEIGEVWLSNIFSLKIWR